MLFPRCSAAFARAAYLDRGFLALLSTSGYRVHGRWLLRLHPASARLWGLLRLWAARCLELGKFGPKDAPDGWAWGAFGRLTGLGSVGAVWPLGGVFFWVSISAALDAWRSHTSMLMQSRANLKMNTFARGDASGAASTKRLDLHKRQELNNRQRPPMPDVPPKAVRQSVFAGMLCHCGSVRDQRSTQTC